MKKGIIIALILMSIGFAAVTTSLVINGTINYGYDSDEFGVYFSEAILDGVVHNEYIDEGTKKSITFTTKDLSKQGDRSILEYQVMNNSKQYDAEVAINCERLESGGNVSETQTSEYTEITPSPASLTIKAQESRKGTITVELKKVSTKDIEEKFKCSLTVTPTEREEEANEYIAEDSCNNVAKPNLGTNGKLIPVTIDENGNVTKVNKANEDWYDYCNKKWANAVILKSEPLKSYDDDQQINMDDIEAMFVWIPKYKYRLWNVGVEDPLYTVHSIEIEFDTEDTTDIDGVSCATPMESGKIGNCSNGEYMTHPAFKSFDVDGFWVGKFETGYKDAQSKAGAQQDNSETSHIIIKPDVYSWCNLTVKNMFNAAKGYEENLQSHMMKNTEWGAVAYLSHSIFGINKEVTINNNNQLKTGYAALPTADQSKYLGVLGDGVPFNTAWNTENGVTASTTGNTTGVYDMSGGSGEYVAAYVPESEKDKSTFSKDELKTIDEKYFDVYDKEIKLNSYDKMILGDATGEMGPFDNYEDEDNENRWHNRWYADWSYLADDILPWFARGGAYLHGVVAGQFYFNRYVGAVNGDAGFRIVLAPSN